MAALAFYGMATVTATAASPAYCALYAREYAIDTVQPAAALGLRQSVEDQAYYRCLNQDEDPPLPTASAYFDAPQLRTRVPASPVVTSTAAPTRVEAGRSSPVAAAPGTASPEPTGLAPSWIGWIRSNVGKRAGVAQGEPAVTGSTAAPSKAAGNPNPPPSPQPTVRTVANAALAGPKPVYKGSGFQPWTAEWAAWCAKYFPRSWDPETGTVVHGSSTTGERVLCR
jgi:hypothetical protein